MKVKKMLALVLSLMLVLTSFSSVSALTEPKVLAVSEEYVSTFSGDSIAADPRTEGLSNDSELRVIVELKDKPAIDYATSKGVQVKEINKQELKNVTDNLKNAQAKVKQDIQRNNIKVKYHRSFVVVANGFSATTTLGDAKRIEKLPGVARVVIANEYDRPEPDMITSGDIVKAAQAWNLGYKGEGMIIAIIDTGIDPSHKDMRLSNSENAELTQQEVADLKASRGMVGKWYTSKVPYGYNYYDQNDIILDLGPGASMHGMHVAGTAGANSIDGTGIKGIAPEAQLLAMKVFSNDPNFRSTYADIYINAIEDAIILGADVMNMSLGSIASFVRPTDPEQMALDRAAQNGIMYAGSAGNSGHIAYGYSALPYAKNPDIGVVGAPGLNSNSIQVASIENSHIFADALTYKNGLIGYLKAGSPSPHPLGILNGQLEYVDCKLGLVNAAVGLNDFAGVDVNGKIALIQRGAYSQYPSVPGNFVDKVVNAKNNGAIGVIVYNSAAGGDALMSMAYPTDGTNIPAIFVGLNDGLALKALIAVNENKVEFKNDKKLVVNPNNGKMADSSSWGATPSLDFKPEITAPGVNIYSTFNNNTYGSMSGTSMASPHVAGGSALILQRVDEEFALTGAARQLMTKNLLLSTAEPLPDKGTYNSAYNAGNYTSPRRHGAGVMNLLAAATTPSIVVDKSTGVSKVNLKEIGNVSNFTLKVTNFSDAAVTYNLTGTVGTDLVASGRNRAETQGVYIDGTISAVAPYKGQFPIFFSRNNQAINSIEVPANGEVEFDVTLDLTNAVDWNYNLPLNALFPNGTFVEGFVRLVSPTETVPSIGVPYMGFYGEWDKAPILDDTNYKTANKAQFYGAYTTLSWLDGTTYRFLGYNYAGVAAETNIAFSPNGDGQADKARLLATFLRNAKELQINILSKDGQLLRTITREYDLRKNYYDGGRGAMYKSYATWEWDGMINNKQAADGEYIYQVKTMVDYPGAEWQIVNFPIRVDTSAPAMAELKFDPISKTLTAQASDNHEVRHYAITSITGPTPPATAKFDNTTGLFDFKDYPEGRYQVTVLAQDFAWNTTVRTIDFAITTDKEVPVIFVESPAVMEIYGTDKILAKGYATDNQEIREVKVNGELVPLVFDEATERYNFSQELILQNGGQQVRFEATDISGNSMSINRKIFVDTKAPVVNVTLPETVDMNVDKIMVNGTVTDNMPGISLFINGNAVYSSNASWMYFEGESPVSYSIENYEVGLELGENHIVIEVKDDAGFTTTKEYSVFRKTAPAVNITGLTLTPAQGVNSSNPLRITAAANLEADWDVVIKNAKGEIVQGFQRTASAAFDETWTPAADYALNGIYTVVAKAVYGTESATQTATFTLENPAPLEITSFTVNPAERVSSTNPVRINAVANQSVNWELVIRDFRGMVVKTYGVSATAQLGVTWTPSSDILANGSYTVYIKASNGKETVTQNAGFIVENTREKRDPKLR